MFTVKRTESPRRDEVFVSHPRHGLFQRLPLSAPERLLPAGRRSVEPLNRPRGVNSSLTPKHPLRLHCYSLKHSALNMQACVSSCPALLLAAHHLYV